LGLDAAVWEQCYSSGKHRARIASHAAEAKRRQVRVTPTFIIGNKMLTGALSYDVIKAYVDSAHTTAATTAPATPTPGVARADSSER